MEKESINARFLAVISYLLDNGMAKSKGELAEILGIKPSKFSEILNERMMAGTDLLAIICSSYPQISSYWLLTGEGSMLRPSAVGEPEPREAMPLATTPSIQPQFESLIATIREQAEEIGRLKARIDMLERRPDAAPIG